jgi:flagellar hook-associated protein 2
LVAVERAPEQTLLQQQVTIGNQNIAYGALVTELNLLKSRVDALNDPNLFDSRTAQATDSTVASATADAGAANSAYTFTFTQLATAAVLQGGADISGALNPTNDVAALVLSSANFSTAVTAGTFTVNGQTVTIATSDTLQQVFGKISTATSGDVTGSYDATTDKITLSSSSEIVLGSAADTSNFLQVARLYNNNASTVTSASTLGAVQVSANLNVANLATTISDGGSGNGAFTINGVTINFNAGTDSLANVIQRINSSAAGVIASYDPLNDRVSLTDRNTGDVGISVQDVTGNFVAATKLSSGTLQRGKNLIYTINSGDPLTSLSNTITSSSSGIAGLTVTALQEGTGTTVTVSSDTAQVKSAITDFITEYNKVQSLIDTQTASSTDSKGTVTAGLLAGDRDVADVASQLRRLVFSQVSGLSGAVRQLNALGYDTNGKDNTLALTDSAKLDNALSSSMSDVKAFFTTATTGIAAQLSGFLDRTSGDNGSLVAHQSSLTTQSSDIDQQIADMERLIQQDQQRMLDEFSVMEQARAQINQQMQFLQQRFGTSSTTSTG